MEGLQIILQLLWEMFVTIGQNFELKISLRLRLIFVIWEQQVKIEMLIT